MILETSLARQRHGNGVELHLRLVRGRRITDFMGTSHERVPSVAGNTVAGLELRLEFFKDGTPYASWYAERAPHHVSHGHVEPRRWLPLRDGSRWTDKLGFRYLQTGPLMFVLNPRRPA